MSLNVTASTRRTDDDFDPDDVKGGRFTLAAEDDKEKGSDGKENDGGKDPAYASLSARLLGRRRLVTTAS